MNEFLTCVNADIKIMEILNDGYRGLKRIQWSVTNSISSKFYPYTNPLMKTIAKMVPKTEEFY